MEEIPRASPLPWALPGTWVRLVALAAAYYGLAWVGLNFALSDGVASPIWPPAGLAVAAVALWGRRSLVAIVVAAFFVELTAGVPPAWGLAMAAGNGAEAAVGGWLLARAGSARIFHTLAGVPRFGALAFLAALPAATTGVAALLGSGTIVAEDAMRTWWTWYLGDVVGIVIVAPVLLGLAARHWPRPTLGEAAEGLAVTAVLAAAAYAAFWAVTLPMVFLVLPPVVWMALRFGYRPTVLSLLVLDVVAVLGTQAGHGPFTAGPEGMALLVLQAFMLVLSLSCLALAALAAERRRSTHDSELRVAERTRTLADLNLRLQDEVQVRGAAEQAMAEAQQIAHMGTWRWDVSKPHAVWSAELYRIYGLDPATHVPSYDDYLTRVHPDDVERVKAATNAVFQHQKPYSHDERVRRPDGTWRNLHTWARAVTGADGKLVALVGACQDVTDLVAQEAKFSAQRHASELAAQQEREARLEVRRLQEQADFKTNFLRTAAHELGTPLTPIKIQMRILRDLVARRPDAEETKAVTILERNVDRLQILVRDLLESARLQSGRLRLNPRPMDLAHAVHDVVETFQDPAIQTGIALDAKMPNELAMLGDSDRLIQVLYNLLSNAMKFTPSGGRVHVQADDLGDQVRVVVEDTGSGFTAEQASHLFQPFSQVHDPLKIVKPGSGLGLYICKGIVEQHGGTITAHSDGPGKGARFTVSLPRVAQPPPVSESVIDPKLVAPASLWVS